MAQDAEYIITRAYYILLEAVARRQKPQDLYDDIAKYLVETMEHGHWGYDQIKALVVAVDEYARQAQYLDSYSGTFYKSFEMFQNKDKEVKW